MDQSTPPTAYGVFKPVGRTLIALQTHDKLQSARAALSDLGFAPSSMVQYSAAEMKAQVIAELLSTSPVASFGYELDLIRQYKILAEQGCSFLVVEAPTDVLAEQVADWVHRSNPVSAQHYGHFMIQHLTEKPSGCIEQAH